MRGAGSSAEMEEGASNLLGDVALKGCSEFLYLVSGKGFTE
jgi:hypothetical protein